ncbi:MAG TPA: hypothetical protein VIB39_06985 [Candidatus Angelobacter sp.]|jgi:hypothetical protein
MRLRLCSGKRRCKTNYQWIKEFESKLAQAIRAYLSVKGLGNDVEQRRLQWAAQGIAILVGNLLQGDETWGQSRWVDTVSPSSVPEVLGPGHIALDGLLIFGQIGPRSQWWEPFYGSLQISETSDEIVSYELKLGDAAWGLGKVRYNEHPKGWNWSRPEKWIFVFSKP